MDKILDRPKGILLTNHLLTVYDNAIKLLNSYGNITPFINNKLDLNYLLKIVSLLHDIGKATKEWQGNMGKYPHSLFSAQIVYNLKYDLELPKDLFPIVMRVVAEHHSFWYIRKNGISLGKRKYEKFNGFTFHFIFDEKLQELFSKELSIDLEDLPQEITVDLTSLYDEIEKVEEDSNKIKLYSLLLGILKEADYKSVTSPKYEDTYPYGSVSFNFNPNPLQEKIKSLEKKTVLLIQAPTGIGKTEASLLYAMKFNKRRLFYTIPISFAINVMRDRLQRYFPNTAIDIHHHWSHIFRALKGNEELFATSIFSKRFFNAINIIAPDLLVLTLLKSGDWAPRLMSIYNSTIIFDECHLYDPVFFWFTIYSAKRLYEIFRNVNFVFMTATAPPFLKDVLKQEIRDLMIIDGRSWYNVNRNLFNKSDIKKGIFPIFREFIKEKDTIDIALKKAKEGKKVLIVRNSIVKAQELYRKFQEKGITKYIKIEINNSPEDKTSLEIVYREVEGIPVVLAHRRFTFGDRFGREKLIQEWDKINKGCIIIATQIVEVSLDIDFDVLITDIAPIPAIVQRLGRINRKRNRKNTEFYFIIPSGSQYWKPYGKEEVDNSYQLIEEKLNNKRNQETEDLFWLELVEKYYEPLKDKFIRIGNNKISPASEVKEWLDQWTDFIYPNKPIYLSTDDLKPLQIIHEHIILEELLFADTYKNEVEELKRKISESRKDGDEKKAFEYFALLGTYALPIPLFFLKDEEFKQYISTEDNEMSYVPYDKELGLIKYKEDCENFF